MLAPGAPLARLCGAFGFTILALHVPNGMMVQRNSSRPTDFTHTLRQRNPADMACAITENPLTVVGAHILPNSSVNEPT